MLSVTDCAPERNWPDGGYIHATCCECKKPFLGPKRAVVCHLCVQEKAKAQKDEKFVTPCPLPTPHERELLIILMEECAEVQKDVSKALRFGLDETLAGHPSNRERVAREIGDIFAVVDRLVALKILDPQDMNSQRTIKHARLDKYLQTSPED